MEREEALQLVKENVKNDKLVKHMLAVEAIMREIAKYLNEDEERWGLVGLLHDIDFEKNKYVIPGIIPPLKLKPVLSNRFIELWYKASKWVSDANKIIIIEGVKL